MQQRVLIIDDEGSVRDVARAYLEREGFAVETAASGRDGLRFAERRPPDLIVLDLMLPDLSGEEVCTEIRGRSDVPILMLTAKATEDQRVHGLELGADDYLVKPFSPRELVARVRAVLRRSAGADTPLMPRITLNGGRLEIDTAAREVVVDGRSADLTPSEYKLLLALARYPGRVYTREELLDRVQGDALGAYERTVDAHIKNLRRKIEDDPRRPRYVETVHGIGYRLGARP